MDAKKAILKDGAGKINLYANEGDDRVAHEATMRSIADRFISEADNAVHRGAGELKEGLDDTLDEERQIKTDIKNLIIKYATDNDDAKPFGDAEFVIERNRIYDELKKLGLHSGKEKIIDSGMLYADNLHDMAREAREQFLAAKGGVEGLRAIDFDYDIVIGKAKAGVRTEAQYQNIDRVVAKAQELSGKYGFGLFNEATVASVVSVGHFFTYEVIKRAARSRLLALASFGISAGLAGATAGARERTRLEDLRRQHARDMAQGKSFDEKASPIRKTMEEFRHETKSAVDLTTAIRDALKEDRRDNVLLALAQAEARIQVSDTEGVDLISFSSEKSVDRERLVLDEIIANAKVTLRKMGGVSADDPAYATLVSQDVKSFTDGDGPMERRNELFSKMKNSMAWKKGLKTSLVSTILGVTFQEGVEHIKDAIGDDVALNLSVDRPRNTPLRALWNTIFMPKAIGDEAMHYGLTMPDGVTRFAMPESVDMIKNSNGTYNLMRGGDVVVGNLELDDNDRLTTESLGKLSHAGITPNKLDIGKISEFEEVEKKAADYLAGHDEGTHLIKRDMWYDNDTAEPVFDKNELQLRWGAGGVGVSADGRYALSVASMMPDGSFHDKFSVDAQNLMKGENGDFKMLFSLSQDTQNQVFEVPIDKDGNVLIDPDSQVGRLMFSIDPKTGQTVFNGRFAEVAQSMGFDSNGVERVRILSTLEGGGVESVLSNEEKTRELFTYRLFFPEDQGVPIDVPEFIPLIPVLPTTPMEPTKKEEQSVRPTAPQVLTPPQVPPSPVLPTEDGEPQTAGNTQPEPAREKYIPKVTLDIFMSGFKNASTLDEIKNRVKSFPSERVTIERADGEREITITKSRFLERLERLINGLTTPDQVITIPPLRAMIFEMYNQSRPAPIETPVIELAVNKESIDTREKIVIPPGETWVIPAGSHIWNAEIIVSEGASLDVRGEVNKASLIRVMSKGNFRASNIKNAVIVAEAGSAVELLDVSDISVYKSPDVRIRGFYMRSEALRRIHRIQMTNINAEFIGEPYDYTRDNREKLLKMNHDSFLNGKR